MRNVILKGGPKMHLGFQYDLKPPTEIELDLILYLKTFRDAGDSGSPNNSSE